MPTNTSKKPLRKERKKVASEVGILAVDSGNVVWRVSEI